MKVKEMIEAMVKWLINKNIFVILDERNEEFENKRKDFWKDNT